MGKIFVPIVGPSETKRAIAKAVDIARELDLELIAINVVDKESIAKLQRYKIFIEEESAMFEDSMKRDAEKYLNYAKKIGEEHGVRVSSVLLEGDPFSEIYDHIRNENDDLVFVCIAKKPDASNCKDVFGAIEKKILLKTKFDIIIVGGDE